MTLKVQVILIASRVSPFALQAPLLKITLHPTVLTGAPTLASVRVVYPLGQTALFDAVTTATTAPGVVVVVCVYRE